jgi:hypothetical protein
MAEWLPLRDVRGWFKLSSLWKANSLGQTPFALAFYLHDAEVANRMLAIVASNAARMTQDEMASFLNTPDLIDGRTPLMWACALGWQQSKLSLDPGGNCTPSRPDVAAVGEQEHRVMTYNIVQKSWTLHRHTCH